MKLTRLRVESFKRFRTSYEIDGLEAGLNLFVAPNESGKSTLTEAIKAAFFERSRSGSVEHLRPWGDSSAIPTVELEFEWKGEQYSLTKSFLGKKRCDLNVNGRRLDGAEAEDHLALLLGFQYPGRGASSPEHMGIPGLLWIRQGSSHELNACVGHASDHLRNALGSFVGEITMGAGDNLIGNLEAERGKLLTPGNSNPRGDYLAAIRREQELVEQIDMLVQQISAYRDGVDKLGRLRTEHAEDELQKPWEHLRMQLALATEKLAQARGLANQCEQARMQAEQSDIQVTALRGRVDAFQLEEELLRTRYARLTTSQADLESRHSLLQVANARLEATQQAHVDTASVLTAARLIDRHASVSSMLKSLTAQFEKLQANLAQATGLNQKVVDLTARNQNVKVGKKEMQQAQTLQQDVAGLQARVEAVATALEFNLKPGAQVRLAGELIQPVARLNLFAKTSIDLGELGAFNVIPGGAELSQWLGELKEKKTALAQLLDGLSVKSLPDLQQRQLQSEALLAELDSAKAVLAVLAPDGLNQLAAEHMALAGQIQQMQQQETELASMLPDLADKPVPAIHEAELQESKARSLMESAAESAQNARLAHSRAQAAHQEIAQEHDSLAQRLTNPERETSKADALRNMTEALQRQVMAKEEWQRLLASLNALNLQVLQQDVQRLELSAKQAENMYQQRLQQISALDAELQTKGALGQEEQLAKLQLELALVEKRRLDLCKRADALTLLLDLLLKKRQELALKLQAPLQKHLQHYLNILWPGTQVELEDDLSIRRIQRTHASGAEAGTFEELSMGAREQMGIVARLAYADLLQESDRPTLLVLDDALVHSDKDRLSQMKRVLFDASTRHQILVFSCHPNDWNDLGVRKRIL